MNLQERHKAISNAVASAVSNPLAPDWAKVGLAALAEEVRELRAQLGALQSDLAELRKEIDA